MSDAERRLVSGRAWDDFCESVRRAGHLIERFGDEVDALDRAEWYRFMTRFLPGRVLQSTGTSCAVSSSVKMRERMMKRRPVGPSIEKPAPRPGTTSIVMWVWDQ